MTAESLFPVTLGRSRTHRRDTFYDDLSKRFFRQSNLSCSSAVCDERDCHEYEPLEAKGRGPRRRRCGGSRHRSTPQAGPRDECLSTAMAENRQTFDVLKCACKEGHPSVGGGCKFLEIYPASVLPTSLPKKRQSCLYVYINYMYTVCIC